MVQGLRWAGMGLLPTSVLPGWAPYLWAGSLVALVMGEQPVQGLCPALPTGLRCPGDWRRSREAPWWGRLAASLCRGP